MNDYEFVRSASRGQKVRIAAYLGLIFIIIAAVSVRIYISYKKGTLDLTSFNFVKNFVSTDIRDLTPAGLFYLSFLGGFFFILVPVEALFFVGLTNGNPAWTTALLVIIAHIPGHAIDYFLGKKLSNVLMHFISRKRVYASRRWVNRYGPYAIFLFNLVPLPSPMLTFALGITRYNIVRLFAYMLAGTILKYMAIVGFFLLFN